MMKSRQIGESQIGNILMPIKYYCPILSEPRREWNIVEKILLDRAKNFWSDTKWPIFAKKSFEIWSEIQTCKMAQISWGRIWFYRKCSGTNLIWWMFCEGEEKVGRQQSCPPLGKICLETSLKLWMWAKNSEMPLMSTQALPRQTRNSFFSEFSPRLFTFLGLSCLHRLLTNFPFLPRG